MPFEPPAPVEPSEDERELLLRFLQRQRAEVIATADDLSEEQAWWTPPQGLLPIAGIIKHLAHMEWRWVFGRYSGQECLPREDDEFRPGGATLASAIDAYWEQAQGTDVAVRQAESLDVACLGREGDMPPAHVLLGMKQPLSLRWVVLHMIEETAHHAGHADSTREMLDGRRMRAG